MRRTPHSASEATMNEFTATSTPEDWQGHEPTRMTAREHAIEQGWDPRDEECPECALVANEDEAEDGSFCVVCEGERR